DGIDHELYRDCPRLQKGKTESRPPGRVIRLSRSPRLSCRISSAVSVTSCKVNLSLLNLLNLLRDNCQGGRRVSVLAGETLLESGYALFQGQHPVIMGASPLLSFSR